MSPCDHGNQKTNEQQAPQVETDITDIGDVYCLVVTYQAATSIHAVKRRPEVGPRSRLLEECRDPQQFLIGASPADELD
jgi:hypothetical protein